jgi:hypothetical protein
LSEPSAALHFEVPATTKRRLIGVLLLSPAVVSLLFVAASAIGGLLAGANPIGIVGLLLLAGIVSEWVWFAGHLAWAAGRFFKEHQTVWREGDVLVLRRVGLCPPAVVSRVALSKARVVRFRWDATMSGFRPVRSSRLAVGLANLPLAPSFTEDEGEELARALNAVVTGQVPRGGGDFPWWVRVVPPNEINLQDTQPTVVTSSLGFDMETQAYLANATGAVALFVIVSSAWVVLVLSEAQGAWAGVGIVAMGIPVFFAARALYARGVPRWTLAPALCPPGIITLMVLSVILDAGWDSFLGVGLFGALVTAAALALGALAGWRANKRIEQDATS